MLVAVVVVDESVVVRPIGNAVVVGRVNVDAVDFSCVRVLEHLQGVVVLSLNHEVPRRFRVGIRPAYLAETFKSRKQRLTEPRNGS